MIKFFTITLICLLTCLFSGCSQVLQTVDLQIDTLDQSIQDEFNVVEKVLTTKEARKQNKSPYNRLVLQHGRGDKARTINEKLAVQSNFPNRRFNK